MSYQMNIISIGVIVGDAESWEIFEELLLPIVAHWHGQLHENDVQFNPVVMNTDESNISKDYTSILAEYVISSRVKISRNFKDYSFPCNLNQNDRECIEIILKQIFEELNGSYSDNLSVSMLEEKQFFDLEYLKSSGERNKLFKNQYFNKERMLGLFKSWPENRGIYFNKDSPNKSEGCFIY
jgi:creatine kinase